MMRVWLITVGEPLPTDGGNDRLFRAGILADLLHRRGHAVTWWTSTFDHVRKRHRFDADTARDVDSGYRLVLLHGTGYTKNISLRRIADHRATARAFARLAETEKRPDVILCSLPTLELSAAATEYGRRHGVPVLLDLRDLWPDVMIDHAPRWARGLARLLLTPMRREARAACAAATGILGVTPDYVEWGVRHAGRPAGEFDRDFPMAYAATEPSADALAAANAFWAEHGLTPERNEFVACFFGYIGHQFDLGTVIEAARRMRDRGRAVRFVLCGTGSKLADYQAQARGLDSVFFPGWVGVAEIWTLMRLSAVGLAPYREVGHFTRNLPNKPPEYFSAGLPVLTSLSAGVLAELLERHECGLTYRNGDAESLVDALTKLMTDADRRRRMSSNALALYRRSFVADAVYGEMIDFLQTVADRFRGTVIPVCSEGRDRPARARPGTSAI